MGRAGSDLYRPLVSSGINKKAIAMASTATVVSDTFSTFHDILNSNAIQITNNNGDNISLYQDSWFGAFPDIKIEDSSNYPLGIIHTPEMNESIEGFAFNDNELTVQIVCFDTRAEHPPKFVEKAWNQLKQNEDTLQDEGFVRFYTDEAQTNMTPRGQRMKVHEYLLPVNVTLAGV